MGFVSGAMSGMPQMPQQPGQPQVPAQGGKGGVQQPPVQPTVQPTLASAKGQPQVPPSQPSVPPTLASAKGQPSFPFQGQPPGRPIPPQGSKGNMPLPEHYQSPYATYGFDPGLQSYLDQQNFRSANDAGVAFQYDPTNQTFTGGTMGGRYNPIPLSVMQQAAGGNRDVLNPYFQSRFPQPTGPVPAVRPRPPVIQPGPNVFPRPQQPGLGGLQVNKFRNRLG